MDWSRSKQCLSLILLANSRYRPHPGWPSSDVESGISTYESLFVRFGGPAHGSRKTYPLILPTYSRETHLSRNDNAAPLPVLAGVWPGLFLRLYEDRLE